MSSSQVRNSHFFKVILESNIRDGELRVPKGFVKKYWKDILNPVFVRLPNGTERRIYWIEKDGDVWFSNGWKEFAQCLSLEATQFLLFRYEGKSSFHVIVFGKTTLEIEYPLPAEGVEVKDESDYYSLEILDDFDKSNHKRPKFQTLSSHERKKMKINLRDEPEYYSSNAETKHEKKKTHNAGFGNGEKCAGSGRDFYERINDFHNKVNQNFHSEKLWFICPMKKTYIERDLLVLPKKFAKTNLQMKEGEATLYVGSDGERTWDVMMKHYCSVRQLNFVRGWNKFVEDNKLNLGDVCAFVMNKCNGVSFKIVIFPFEDDSSLPYYEDQDQKRLCNVNFSSLKANSRVMSKNHFTIPIKQKHNVYYATIPIEFMRRHVTLGGEYAKLRVGKRSWLVKVLHYPYTNCSARFSDGWSLFFRECNLEVGDSCRFEMIDEENRVLDVSISKLKH